MFAIIPQVVYGSAVDAAAIILSIHSILFHVRQVGMRGVCRQVATLRFVVYGYRVPVLC